MFRSIDVTALVDLSIWRVVYGAALLAIGVLGGLPSEFFWSAATGDIVVGLWGLGIMQRKPAVSTREVIFWNVAGLLDLVHVLALGAIYLRGFYLGNPDVARLNLLPLVGVPLLLSLHLQTLFGQLNIGKTK